jgi:hypothetical protein
MRVLALEKHTPEENCKKINLAKTTCSHNSTTVVKFLDGLDHYLTPSLTVPGRIRRALIGDGRLYSEQLHY